MTYNNFSSILLAFIPIYFYYAPNVIMKTVFLKFIKKTVLNLGLIKSPSKNMQLNLLEERLSRIISFLSFLSIFIGTATTMILTTFSSNTVIKDNLDIYTSVIFLTGGVVLIIKNFLIEDKFMVKAGFILFENFLVFLSAFITISIL